MFLEQKRSISYPFKEKKKPHCFVAYPFYYFKLRRISNGHTTDGGFLSALVLKGCRLSDLGRTNICFSLWKKNGHTLLGN